MSAIHLPAYKHSGKFTIHGPIWAFLAAVVGGFVLGHLYALLEKWIPFIYVNLLLVAGYGFAFSVIGGQVMCLGRVRNSAVALVTGIFIGLSALYFAWNGHVHSVVKEAPWLVPPDGIIAVAKVLYEEGSWSLRGGSNVTGVTLAVVWLVEAGIIVGLAAFGSYSAIAETPFCETSGEWLSETTTISTLSPFTDPGEIQALGQGDLSSLTKAKPAEAGAKSFGRLVLQHSPNAKTFFTLRVENVVKVPDKEGNETEKVTALTKNLVVPESMRELINGFKLLGTSANQTLPESPAPVV